MLICRNCSETFIYPHIKDVSFQVPYGEGKVLCPMFEERCPYCGSEEIEKAYRCFFCGDYIFPEKELCENCEKYEKNQ